MDYVVSELVASASSATKGSRGRERLRGKARMDPTNAASWGLFCTRTETWDHEALAAVGIPSRVMPEIVSIGGSVGPVCGRVGRAALFGGDDGQVGTTVAIYAAVGDHPAGVYATIAALQQRARDPDGPTIGANSRNARVGLLNIGTSSQFSAVLPPPTRSTKTGKPEDAAGWELEQAAVAAGAEVRPFFHGQRLLVAAALSGGNTLATFAHNVKVMWARNEWVAVAWQDWLFVLLGVGWGGVGDGWSISRCGRHGQMDCSFSFGWGAGCRGAGVQG